MSPIILLSMERESEWLETLVLLLLADASESKELSGDFHLIQFLSVHIRETFESLQGGSCQLKASALFSFKDSHATLKQDWAPSCFSQAN